MVYEVGNSILKNQQLTREDAGEAIASILQLGIRLLAPNAIRAGRTMTIARLRHTTFYDAAYLQTAEELRAPLITADESQARAGNGIARIVHLREFTV